MVWGTIACRNQQHTVEQQWPQQHPTSWTMLLAIIHLLFGGWKKKKKVYKHELNRVKVHAHSFSISFICSKVKLVLIPGIIIQNWFHFCLPTIPRSLKVVKYTTKKMERCKTNVWSPCNTASQYFNDYTCHSHNWILLRLLHVYEFRIFVVFFQLCTAFSSTNKSSQFCSVFRGFLFSKKKNYLRQWRTVWEFLYDIQGEIAVIQLKFIQPHVSSRNTCSSTYLAFGKQYGSNHGSWHEF